jgi:hypothetical protein
MLYWHFWLVMLEAYTRPVTVQVRLPPATIYDFAAERAKRRKA